MDPITLIGKRLLVGITFVDADDKLIEHFQTHGRILLIDESKGIVIEKADGSGTFSLPPSVEDLRPAARGEYRLRSTGEIVIDPDFLSEWTVHRATADTLEVDKRQGFTSSGPARKVRL